MSLLGRSKSTSPDDCDLHATGHRRRHRSRPALMGAYTLALVAGVISFSSPCCLPLMPGYVSYVSGVAGGSPGSVATRSRVLAAGGLFVLGFTLFFTAMGAVRTRVVDTLYRSSARRHPRDRGFLDVTRLRGVTSVHLRARAGASLLPPRRRAVEGREADGLAPPARACHRTCRRSCSCGNGDPDDHWNVAAALCADPSALLEDRVAAAVMLGPIGRTIDL